MLTLVLASAASARADTEGDPWAERVRVQVGLDALAPTLHLALSVTPRVLLGGRLGYSLLAYTSFSQPQVHNALHWELFVRLLACEYAHLEAGFSSMSFGQLDDLPCDSPQREVSTCGTFRGGYAQLALGYRFVYWAPAVRAGQVESEAWGRSFEWVVTPFTLRFVVSDTADRRWDRRD